MTTLVPLPPQPAGAPGPTDGWPAGRADASVVAVDRASEDDERAETYAVVVVHGGRLVAERSDASTAWRAAVVASVAGR